MANRKRITRPSAPASTNRALSSDVSRRSVRRQAARHQVRQLLAEQLEPRQLLAIGPQLIGIQPNNSDLLMEGAVRDSAPRELVFRFDDVQKIDTSTLAGIRLTAAGGDGRFDHATAESDFGSHGTASIQLTSESLGQSWNVVVAGSNLGNAAPPTLAVNGNTLTVTLNTNGTARTTANQLIQAINSSPQLAGRLSARLKGGLATATLGHADPASYSPIRVDTSHDRVIAPGAVLVGSSPNENEVTLRFAEALKDDLYRIDVFGFDDPARNIVGLRNVGPAGPGSGDLFQPTRAGTRQDTIHFRLDLGPQVTAVVPQPVVRVGTQLQQQRDTIIVYFDSDKMLVENGPNGTPTSRSVENPEFYQLIFTRDTVRNTDDEYLRPQSVQYNALTNTATLKFAGDLNDLVGAGHGPVTYRLRIGTRETQPIAPVRMDAAATAITDLNTGSSGVQMRFTAKQAGEAGNGIRLEFTNSLSGNPTVNVVGRTIQVDLGRSNLTAGELKDLLEGSAQAAALIRVELASGSLATVIGGTSLSNSPITLVGMGSTFDTSLNLGQIGSASLAQTSLILSSSIDPKPLLLDLLGDSSDPGHRRMLQGLLDNFEDHINPAFGADATDGVKTIFYNFRSQYAQNLSGTPLTNSINDLQKQRAREILSLWSRYVGVQFVETVDLGLTIAVGAFNSLNVVPNTRQVTLPLIQVGTAPNTTLAQPGSVRVDPAFNSSLIVLSAEPAAGRPWSNQYGENFSRVMAASVGLVLGLANGGDLANSELMRFDPIFLAGNDPLIDGNDAQLNANDERYEPVFPGNQDILHAQYIHRPDSTDIDFYRFEINLGAADRVGSFVAETYAQRLADSSQLDTLLQLYRERNAMGQTTFNVGGLLVEFESLRPGALGNQFQVFFTQSELGAGTLPGILVSDNAISIDLNSTQDSETTVQEILDAIAGSPEASRLVKARLMSGNAATRVGGRQLTQNPVRLVGGSFELIAQNDDYFSRDSLIRQTLGSGVYYIGVSASGNNQYNGSVQDSGFGGRTQGDYELRLDFRAGVNPSDTLQDTSGQFAGDRSMGLDGNLDGSPGGTYDFWFQTRPLNRTLTFNAGGSAALEGHTVTIVGANGTQRVFEFSSDLSVAPGRIRIGYDNNTTAAGLATAVANAINARTELGVTASANGIGMMLSGERSIALNVQLQQLNVITVGNRMIFVDKAAGPNADGSLAKPFNNISATAANAFAAALPGDIVRIVANGGTDNNVATVENNFAYEIGRGVLAGSTLSDGLTMDIPKGVITMVDAGAVFKLRQAAIQAGSSNLNIDRNGAVLQILGTPVLLNANGNPLRSADGSLAGGQVYFTSWLDERIGLDNYTPTTTPAPGDWGGIMLRRDVDRSAGRGDLEDEAIFLRNINYADIRYGGGIVNIDSVQQVINPVHILANRPTITNNSIRYASSAAISADPSALEETTFNEPRYQAAGAFTSDYDRVGPSIHGNRLTNNSINALFISVETPVDGTPRTLTVPARLNDTDIVHVLTENLIIVGALGGAFLDNTQVNPIKTPRLSASLVIDPGIVLKMEAARIEAQMGANIIAEGVDGLPIYFTSRMDDTIGAGGTFDTNNNGSQTLASPGDWGGIYVAPTSRLSMDHSRVSYAGGVTRLEGTFRAFNTIEVQQADARIANSTFTHNADGMGGQGPGTRHGRLSNSPATIFVRGAQPTLIGNTFVDNAGSIMRIDVNSLTDEIIRDAGRQTGAADRDVSFIANRGPLIRNNRAQGNDLNGLEIRSGTLTVGSVWDDTDIVHVVRGPIFTGNIQHSGGLRLQSSPTESLVVKFDGYGSNFNRNMGAGITANGQLTSAPDRVGGTLHIVGHPAYPVILTSLKDDSVGAGQRPDGAPQTDTNNDGIGSIPQAADWRGVLIDQYANDRNVAIVLEAESPRAAAPGSNATTATAQVLGDLAGSTSGGNENLRLGLVVEGVLSQPEDVDVYSFTGVSGSEVWLDVDYTRHDMDMILELLDAQGNLLARSTSSTLESEGQLGIFTTGLIPASYVAPLNARPGQQRTNISGLLKEDGTININDPGLKVRLPGTAGARSTFYFRVRSRGQDVSEVGAGLSAGAYQVQVRLREAQEWAGSTVNYADIRYAMNGVHLRGMPGESPLIGEAIEDESVDSDGSLTTKSGATTANNGVATGNGRLPGFGNFIGVPQFGDAEIGNRPQYLGNILSTAKGAISVAGNLSNSFDLDFYMFEVRPENLVAGQSGGYAPVVFDIDYADGLNRPDVTLNIFQQETSAFVANSLIASSAQRFQYRLIYTSGDSQVADDQPRPLAGNDLQDLSRGSAGARDPFIGPIALPIGTYLVSVSSTALQPRAILQNPGALQPINSLRRIVDTAHQPGITTAAAPVVTNFLTQQNIVANQALVSAAFNLGAYSAADQPNVYLTYTHSVGTFQVFVRNSAGTETLIGTSGGINPTLLAGVNRQAKLSLANFAGQDGLQLVFRSTGSGTVLNRTIIGFAERGESRLADTEAILLNAAFLQGPLDTRSTRTFSLETYTNVDSPALSFAYEIFEGELDAYVITQSGAEILIATSVDDEINANVVELVNEGPQTGLISLNRWANQPGLRIEFRTRDDEQSFSLVQNVYIELASGAQVANGEANSTFSRVTVPSTAITTGNYQLEVRLGDNFFQSQAFGAPLLTRSFDTNDRLADGVSIIAPSGANITVGDQFSVSAGGNVVVFEFTQNGTVSHPAHIAVPFNASHEDFVVARTIRDAINSSTVQSRLAVRAASSSGIASGTLGRDPRLNLFGNASVKIISSANLSGRIQIVETQGRSDRNVTREQGQVLIQNSFIRQSRDYGVWSEPAGRLLDPRDAITNARALLMQRKPAIVGTQAVRHLPVANDGAMGGLLPGVVIQNNVLEEGGLGGVNISGENPIWMISPLTGRMSSSDNSPFVNADGTHFGFYLDDGDVLLIDSDRTRLRFEFEDMAGGGAGGPVYGSGEVEGNGVAADSSIAWYRDMGGSFYLRAQGGELQAFATNAVETMHALRDSILGSIFVTNGTTQIIKPTIAESLMGPDPGAPSTALSFGYPEYFNRPALYLEGVTNIQFLNRGGTFPNPFDIRTLDLGPSPQPHARVINNTIIGKDGRAAFNGGSALNEPNDTIATAVQTWQGTSGNPVAYISQGLIGDSSANGLPSSDVDLFQFKLGVGERAIINLDSAGSGLQAALQIFDSQGIPQAFNNFLGQSVLVSGNEGPGGTWIGRDPVADFTALKSGVYYAAISSVGNTTYDPLSTAGRLPGTSTGPYGITIVTRTLQEFVITAQDASAYSEGQTFTIHGISDNVRSGSSGVTFEFVFGLGPASDPAHVPVNIDSSWRFPDVARAIAKAINEGNAGNPAIPNSQQLPNGSFGTASPLPAVHARALGGMAGVFDAPLNTIQGDLSAVLRLMSQVDELGTNAVPDREIRRLISGDFWEVNQGLRMFPRRNDGVPPLHSARGIGHDRVSTAPLSLTSLADGTTEKFVVVKNAAYIEGNGSVLVSPDVFTPNNVNQLIPETGVLASRGASPTILNNVFFNVQTPVINEESRRFPITNGPAPYGTNNPNTPIKPGQVILAGSIYQFHETSSSINRFLTGIEVSPTNVPNTAADFNTVVPGSTRLFVNAQAGNYLPAPGSPLIDSAIDSLPERTGLANVKTTVGLSVSPVIAPALDLFGQLRVDDPAVAPPQGQGQNVFKDRGALDRSDTIGPAAILLSPIDNDSAGVDQDPSDAVVQLTSGVYPEFRIQLKDGFEPGNPLAGMGIDDTSVTGSTIEGLRAPGAAVVLLENGRMLTEGFDYRFAYNTTSDEIILTPLAGVWKQGNVYEIVINNRDRFVISASAGHQVSDGDTFSIIDDNGGVVVFEFDSMFRLQVPQNLNLLVPLAGAAFGGVTDGQRLTITNTSAVGTTFEFDTNANVLAGNRAIPITVGASQQAVLSALVSAINSAAIGVTASDAGDGRIALGAQSGVRLNTTATIVDQPRGTLAFEIPANALRGILRDGHSFTLSNGRRVVVFEFDTDGVVGSGNVRIDFSEAQSLRELASLMQQAIAGSALGLVPTIVADDLLYLGLPEDGSVDAGTSPLTVVGTSRTLRDGQFFTITHQGQSRTFEFTTDAAFTPGRVPISITTTDSQNQIANRMVQAIRGSDLGLTPTLVGSGNIVVGGDETTSIDISGASDLGLFGSPGVRSSTRLELFGPLLLQVPSSGASGITDGTTFSLTNDGRTVIFEFDNNFSGPAQTGNVLVRYSNTSTAAEIAQAITTAILTTNLGLAPQTISGGRVSLGRVPDSAFAQRTSSLTTARGLVSDGERFTISVGTTNVTFEFDDVSLSNGFTSGNRAILFGPDSTPQSIISGMQAAINGAGLGLASTILPGNILQLNDSARHSIVTGLAPTLVRSGVPGGANRVTFIPDASFTSEDMKRSLIAAINTSTGNTLEAIDRGGGTLLVSGARSISPELDSYFLRGVADLTGNFLKTNQLDDETRFTILMPGVELDFGDAPDPLSTTLGSYPTLFANNGARHLISDRALLGSHISAEPDGQPSPDASADSNDDGVTFGTNYQIAGLFNRHFQTAVTVTLSSAGFADAWFDWNADGDWNDPGEYILQSVVFTSDNLTQTFHITVPPSAPALTQLTPSVVRFRSSTRGSLAPTGLAVDGEVEDYRIFIAPGTPPTAVHNLYNVFEDTALLTTDATGQITPGFGNDDGVAANDVSPHGHTLGVTLIQGPAHARFFELRSDGTFTYDPLSNYFGQDLFTYRVNDGTLNSNNIGTVTINVIEVNDPPVAVGDNLETDEDVPLAVNQSVLLANDSAGPNETDQTISVTQVQAITLRGGSVTLVAGVITYTPPTNFTGVDTFWYTITDNGTTAGAPAPLTSTATVTITVQDVNDPPLPGQFSTQMQENRPSAPTNLSLSGQTLASLASPGPADEQLWQAVRVVGVNSTSAAGGLVTWTPATSSIGYIPPLHFAGTDTFTYEIEDFSTDPNRPLMSRRAIGTVTVTVDNINDPPFVKTALGNLTIAEDSGAMSIDLASVFDDPDIAVAGDQLTYRLISNNAPTLVNVSVSAGLLQIATLQDQNGQALVVVEAEDLAGLKAQDTLTLTVSPVNDAPRVVNPLGSLTVNKNSLVPSITLSPSRFFDPDVATNGDQLTFAIISNSNPLLVTPSISGNVLNMSLIANQFGISVITVSATDLAGLSVTDSLTLTVTNVNEPPIGRDDSYSVPQGSTLTVAAAQGVLANDSDPEGSPLTAILVSGPAHASQFTLNPNGSFTYRHDDTSRQTDSFTYRASDGQLQSQLVTVTMIIDAPLPSTHQNPVNNLDVDANGRITARDALLIINLLNSRSQPILVDSLGPPPPYYDVDGNYRITARDALLVINELNRRSTGGGTGGGEGESPSSAVDTRSLAFDFQVSHHSENQRYLLHSLPVTEVIGPSLATSAGSNQSESQTDLSWLEQRAAKLQKLQPTDVALAELVDEFLNSQES
ncbi:MAG: tandem-95 repeat protein [Pirellulaceae bacterium]|nr:tandem-95 repeat protein [Pirellulaceae bacterium]